MKKNIIESKELSIMCSFKALSMTFWGQVQLGHNDKLVTLALMYAHKGQNCIFILLPYCIQLSFLQLP